MGVRLRVLGTCLVMGLGGWAARQSTSQEKPKEPAQENTQEKSKEAPVAPQAAEKRNPVKATPEVLAAAKKVFGYDCAMCHGEKADGKGEMVESMKLVMKDWHETTAVDEMSDEAIYDLIVKGKDKMVGEADRLKPAQVWGLVHYVRTLAKKKGV